MINVRQLINAKTREYHNRRTIDEQRVWKNQILISHEHAKAYKREIRITEVTIVT
jgi:hypothetical protein